MPYDPDLSYLIKTYSSQQFMFFFYIKTHLVYSHSYLSVYFGGEL